MAFGIRKPNYMGRLKARTTGKLKRKVKRSINPLYGKKGIGFIKNPERSLKNSVYNRTTVSIPDALNSKKTRRNTNINNKNQSTIESKNPYSNPVQKPSKSKTPVWVWIIVGIFIVGFICSIFGTNEGEYSSAISVFSNM